MPWKESYVMDERMRFVIRLKDGELASCHPSLCWIMRPSVETFEL